MFTAGTVALGFGEHFVQVCVCKMKQGRNGGYVRDGVSVELMASSLDTHGDILEKARETFNLKLSEDLKILKLFTLSGAVIPCSEDWSLGSYLKRCHKSEGRIGVGYVEVCEFSISNGFIYTVSD